MAIVYPKKPRGFGPPRAKKAKARFTVGDSVEALVSLRHTGLPVGQGERGNVVLVQGTRVFVNWGGETLTGTNVSGWVDQDVLL